MSLFLALLEPVAQCHLHYYQGPLLQQQTGEPHSLFHDLGHYEQHQQLDEHAVIFHPVHCSYR